ncbi:hypothetical protein K438DRAFT_2007552 [Mycena galopus ATCC 62051]|nr:hypothetical protein K438DRAFT_2007552 [Mycena galopus ATCC 62051]
MSSRPAKRKRTEHAPITRSTTWKTDGSVVLQAANMQFRVHWSVLSENSSFFRDMQGLPQPPDQPTVEGCPIVELSDDDPEDVEHVLKVLYSPTFLEQKALPLPVIAALIRLGRKYDFKNLFDSALARLTSEYPTTLQEYDALPDGIGFTSVEEYPGLDLDIISLATEHSISSILPYAYYYVLRTFSLIQLFDGISRGDGTVACPSGLDLRRCVIARERLLAKQCQPDYTFGWTRKDFCGCTTPAQCRTLRDGVLSEYLDDADIGALALPFYILDGFKFCAACTRHAYECMIAGRKKIWDELPGFFDLPPWDELGNET